MVPSATKDLWFNPKIQTPKLIMICHTFSMWGMGLNVCIFWAAHFFMTSSTYRHSSEMSNQTRPTSHLIQKAKYNSLNNSICKWPAFEVGTYSSSLTSLMQSYIQLMIHPTLIQLIIQNSTSTPCLAGIDLMSWFDVIESTWIQCRYTTKTVCDEAHRSSPNMIEDPVHKYLSPFKKHKSYTNQPYNPRSW